jgi:beta-mannosidase
MSPARASPHRAASGARALLLAAAAAALLAVAAVPTGAHAAETTHLSDGPWKLSNANGSLTYTDIQLPVYPHQVLQSKGVIGDPLYRYNELETRWVSDDTWTYSRDFVATPQQAASPAADLLFKGLDTFAAVSLNGDVILRADNFHRTWRVPVAGLLKEGKNTLTITLEPALETTLKLKKDLPYTVATLAQPGALDVFNYVRKGAYSFGWGELF